MAEILIIDDDEQVCKTFLQIFSRMGHTICYHRTLKDGLAKIFSDNVDVVFLDVNLPDGNGLEAIEIIRTKFAAPEIIIITGDANVEGAELAMRSKAWDYISKNEPFQKIKFALERALEYRRQKQSNQAGRKIDRDTIVGESRQISICLEQVSKAAANDLSILITGETGTGKDLFSRAIHNNSKRAHAGFVVVDCAALPENLVESALFGHVKGAFTGADSDKTGLMVMADKGTLFLDEVGELPLTIQKKFLRALQEKKVRPVGGKNETESDFRLICATHRNLRSMVKENTFREDLFFRIYSMHIYLPPLKERENDIKLLIENHLSRKGELLKKKSCTVSKEFLDEVQMYEWPGNVRELINTIDLVCSEAGAGNTLFPHHLPGHIRAFNIRNKFNASNGRAIAPAVFLPCEKKARTALKFKDYIEKMKVDYLQELLSTAKGNVPEACKQSSLSRSQLYRLMQQYKLNIY